MQINIFASAKPFRFLALGDSYTIGESVPPSARWPEQFAATLRSRGQEVEPVTLVAQTGWTTDELQQAIAAARLKPPYDLVSLLIGVNNQYRGLPLDEFKKEFAALLRQAIAFADGRAAHVLVLSIPDWGVTPFAGESGRDLGKIAQEIDAFNASKRDIARRSGAHWVDITDLTRNPGAQPAMLTLDGLHPSQRQYALWTQRIFDQLPEA